MDEPVFYTGKKRPGLFFVETKQYLPMRGNGWYSQPMIEYCLNNGLIYEDNIKYALYSGLTIPSNYYVKFIDYLYNSLDNKAKLSVNTIIGSFKPKIRESWKSKFITTNPNEAYSEYLQLDGAFIHTKEIADQYYYQLFDVYTTEKNETEAPVYNQILDLEAIEVHRLISEIEKRGGQCLSVRTDCVECVFPDDIFPFYHDPKDDPKVVVGEDVLKAAAEKAFPAFAKVMKDIAQEVDNEKLTNIATSTRLTGIKAYDRIKDISSTPAKNIVMEASLNADFEFHYSFTPSIIGEYKIIIWSENNGQYALSEQIIYVYEKL